LTIAWKASANLAARALFRAANSYPKTNKNALSGNDLPEVTTM
jgi:hypothetical protein